jgi:hypothetical protein
VGSDEASRHGGARGKAEGFAAARAAQDAERTMSKIGALRELLFDLLAEHERDGTIPTNARFLFYELVQRGELSKERKGARRPDQDLHDALTDLREEGRIPWDWIVDETRSLDSYTGHATIKQGALDALRWVALDPWCPRFAGADRKPLAGRRAALRRRRLPRAHRRHQRPMRRLPAYRNRAAARTAESGVIYLGDLDLETAQLALREGKA